VPDRDLDAVFFLAPSFRRRERRIGGEVRAMHDAAKRLPLTVASYCKRDPLVFADAGKATIGHINRVPVADPRTGLAGRGLFDDRRRHQRQHAFHLTEIDILVA